jgi:hypothetical protein
METVKVKYKGIYKVICEMPGYVGIVNPGETYLTTKLNYENELKFNDKWELVAAEKNQNKKG